MAKNIRIAGATYSSVPAIDVPLSTSGTARFYDCTGSQTVTENGTVNVTGLAELIVNVAGSKLGKFTTGEYKVTTAFTYGTRATINHELGEVPDLFMFWAPANVATTYSMLMVARGSLFGWRSTTYQGIAAYHGNSTSTVTMANVSTANYAVPSLTANAAEVTTYSNSTSYYWRAGTYKWIAIKFT